MWIESSQRKSTEVVEGWFRSGEACWTDLMLQGCSAQPISFSSLIFKSYTESYEKRTI